MMKRTEERTEAILNSLISGATVVDACRAAKVDRPSFYNWLKEDPLLKAVIDEARETRVEIVEDSLYKNAIAGNVQAQIFFLKSRCPERWKDRGHFEESVSMPQKVTIKIIRDLPPGAHTEEELEEIYKDRLNGIDHEE